MRKLYEINFEHKEKVVELRARQILLNSSGFRQLGRRNAAAE
jgi:hypothetical protein